MNWRVVSGVAAVVGPVLALVLALADTPAGRAWPRSPPEPASAPQAPPRWNEASVASLALLRRVTARAARSAQRDLAACEARARHGRLGSRPARFRRCALIPISRTGSFASSNSHMLFALLDAAEATRACRGRVLALSGTTGTLAMVARGTARASGEAPWSEILSGSRSIRGLARQSLALARAPDFARACRPREAAPPAPSGPVA